MIKNFNVPSGKTLVVPIGGYRFVGPTVVNLSKAKLPETFEDGTPTDDSTRLDSTPEGDEDEAELSLPTEIESLTNYPLED